MKKIKRWASVLLILCMLLAGTPAPAESGGALTATVTAEQSAEPENTATAEPENTATAEPENTPAFSASMLGARATGSRRQVTRSALETWPQCMGPHCVPKGWSWKNTCQRPW